MTFKAGTEIDVIALDGGEHYASIAREYAARIQSLGVSEMDFSAVALTEAQQAFAEEVRAFLDEHLTPAVYAGMRERADSYDEAGLPGRRRQGLA